MLVVAVLLTSGLMAASEMPELLTLTDNVSNDYELTCQCLPGCSTQQIVRSATTPSRWLVPLNSQLVSGLFLLDNSLRKKKFSFTLDVGRAAKMS